MKTRLPISTISYNSVDFLRLKLEELCKSKIISEWYFVPHKPEDDEAGGKEHCHVWIVPSKQVQTDDLLQELLEYDPAKPDKPRKCLPFRTSKKFDDWYLYSIHDVAYLATKGQSRRYHYTVKDVSTFDEDCLNCRIREIDMLDLSPYRKLVSCAAENLSFGDVFMRGFIPIQQISQYKQAYELIIQNKTYRAEKSGHDDDFAEEVALSERLAPSDSLPDEEPMLVQMPDGSWQEVSQDDFQEVSPVEFANILESDKG